MSSDQPIDLTIDSSPEIPSRQLPHRRISPIPRFRLPTPGPPLQAEASSSRTRPRQQSPQYIPSDSEDDDVVAGTSSRAHRAPRPRPTNRTAGREFRANLANIDAALARHDAGLRRMREDRMEPEVRTFPVPEAGDNAGAAPRIGLGGAVFRNGPVEVRFVPGRQAQHLRVDRRGNATEVDPSESATRRQPRRGVRDRTGVLPGFLQPAFDAMDHFPLGLGVRLPFDERVFQARLPPNLVHLFDRLTGRGAAPQADDVPAIIARVTIPTIPPARAGYTSTWDIVDVEAALPIELDERGRVLPTKRKPYLACANCPEPLRASAGVRTDDDRVWALKCGHLLDERCFKALAGAPGAAKDEAEIKANEQEEVEPSPKRRKARKAKPAPLQDHTWNCPTCSREHVSQTVGGEWKQKEGLGATQIFV